jgi:hypothetical protein
MVRALELVGRTFGFWYVESRAEEGRRSQWLCTCRCGNQKIVVGSELTGGRSSSCGCMTKSLISAANTKHGMSDTQVYRAWAAMHSRCSDNNSPQYAFYGGRGIRVCKRWDKFENFYADMGNPPSECSIERKNNNGMYSPKNCVWATPAEQHKNRRNSLNITFCGVTDTLAAHARRAGLRYDTVHYRIFRRGWPVDDALTTKPFAARTKVAL